MSEYKADTFRKRFTELIESSQKSRAEIAREFGIAKQTISAWITGQNSPRRPVIAALAKYFKVDPLWLLGYDCPKHINSNETEQYKAKIQRLQAQIEEMEETIRERDQLIANQGAEITAMRRAIVRITEIVEEAAEDETVMKIIRAVGEKRR